MQNRTTDRALTAIAFLLSTAVAVALPAGAAGQHANAGGGARADSIAVATTVLAYHEALTTGDSIAALALLAPDAVILESGGVESRAEYRAHHLHSDIAFARAVSSERSPVRVVVSGDVAWASSTSTTTGSFRDRPINAAGAELMVLVRTPDGWRIAAIHWSSRNVRG
jgi:ketosteroid isomerase-like protein